MAPVVTAAAALAGPVAAGTAVYSAVAARKGQKEAERKQEEYMRQRELQAGEYYALTEKQMELQAQDTNIKTLSSLIQRQQEKQTPQRILRLPAAKTFTPAEQINQAIHKILGRA